jgi:type III restriction enzyme
VKLRLRSRHQLFPQVYAVVDVYIRRKVQWQDCHPCELGLSTYIDRAVERLYDAIEPDDDQGEPQLLPILNRYKPISSTTGRQKILCSAWVRMIRLWASKVLMRRSI